MESGFILIVDDDPDIAFLERRSLERAGYAVSIASTTGEAMRVIERGGVRLIVLDQRLPGGPTGLDFYARLKELGHDLPVIMVSGHYNETTVIEALRAGARDFVSKSTESLDYLPEAVGRVLDQIRTERLLKESEQRYKSLFEHNADAVYCLDLEGKFLSANAASKDLLGYEAGYMIGKSFAPFVVPEDLEKTADRFERSRQGEPQNYEIAVTHRDGRRIEVSVTNVPIVVEGEVIGIYGMVKDVSRRKALERRLERQAFHDGLTGLPNRALFMDRLDHALARGSRLEGSVAVLFMDLDGFKAVNDSLGHEMGDALLVAVAGRLKGCLRPEDTAARMGGDEFVVLLEDIMEAGDATRVAERIIQGLRKPFLLAGRTLSAKASIGIALESAAGSASADLLKGADIAMYRAKTRRGAGYDIFRPEEGVATRQSLESEDELRRAIERRELSLCYQPVVALGTGKTIGMEALVRWNHPQRGLLPPMKFIPLAEETGLILPLGRWVIEESCRQAKSWREGFPDEAPRTLSINLSAKQLRHPGLSEDVSRILRDTGMDPRDLMLEVSENAVMEDSGAAIEAFRGLRALGVQLAVDDFGREHSSFSCLDTLPVDVLKIDRSFVSGIENGSGDIVSAMIAFAHALRLKVIAEGVETSGQLGRLESLTTDLAQGYYFSRPLPAEAVTELLKTEQSRRQGDAERP